MNSSPQKTTSAQNALLVTAIWLPLIVACKIFGQLNPTLAIPAIVVVLISSVIYFPLCIWWLLQSLKEAREHPERDSL